MMNEGLPKAGGEGEGVQQHGGRRGRPVKARPPHGGGGRQVHGNSEKNSIFS